MLRQLLHFQYIDLELPVGYSFGNVQQVMGNLQLVQERG